MPIVWIIWILLGWVAGSAIDCAIVRRHQGVSWYKGRSACEACGNTLTWIELIPVGSYLVQKGKCRHCGTPISPSCIWSELLMGVAFLYAGASLSLSRENPAMGILMFLVYFMLGMASISDLEFREVDYPITGTILGLGCLAALFRYGLFGIVYIAGIFLFLTLISKWMEDGMGGADILVISGLAGCFHITALGYLLAVPAVIALCIYWIEKRFFHSSIFLSRDGEKGLGYLPAILMATFPIQYIDTILS